jgi:hypothetical protein
VIACSSDADGRLLKGALRTAEASSPRADYRVLSPVEPLEFGAYDFDLARSFAAFAIGRASAEAFAVRNREWLTRT